MYMEKSVINIIIDLLQSGEFYDVSERIDIAKGKNELPKNWKGIKNVVKRNKKY